MVCLNKSLSLDLCDPRRCIRYIGYITPVYPRYKYSAEVQLYWALHGTEGYRLRANPEPNPNYASTALGQDYSGHSVGLRGIA